MIIGTASAWTHAIKVTRPALRSMPPDWLDEVAERLHAAGVHDAVARRDPAPLFDWIMSLVSLQGISDTVAFDFDARHGGVRWVDVVAALESRPNCAKLGSHWAFAGCRYRRGSRTCGAPRHLPACPLPTHPLRKGLLNEAAYALALFVRDVCGNDLVGWIDARLADADPGPGAPDRAACLGAAVVAPLANVVGVGPKLWSMIMAELLLVGDPDRERWVAAGTGLIAIDSLVHNFFARTGVLRRLGAEHTYGPACYGANGCAAVIAGLAARIDARAFNAAYPANFPRFVQHAVWRLASVGAGDVCNGRRIDDRARCRQALRCAAFTACDRVPLRRR